jgi:hypothetical protein
MELVLNNSVNPWTGRFVDKVGAMITSMKYDETDPKSPLL